MTSGSSQNGSRTFDKQDDTKAVVSDQLSVDAASVKKTLLWTSILLTQMEVIVETFYPPWHSY